MSMTPERLEEIASRFNLARNANSWSIVLTGDEMIDIVELAMDGMSNRLMERDMNRNRDWAADFNQGNGRTQRDYGNSGKILPMDADQQKADIAGMIVGSIVVFMMLAAWAAW